MQFGVSTACFYPKTLEYAVDALRDVKTIEVFVNAFSELKQPYFGELKKRIDFNGQKVISIHPFTSSFEPFMLFTEYDRRFEDGLEFHRHYFDVMNIFGSKIFVFHGDRAASPLSNEQYFERFARLRDLGKEYGVTFCQENVERCKSGNIKFLQEMIAYLDNDVSLVFDNKQATRSGVSYEDFIGTLGKNIAHVHLSDSSNTCDCISIGDGDVDFTRLLNHPGLIDFDGCVMVELYSKLISSEAKILESFKLLTSHFYQNF